MTHIHQDNLKTAIAEILKYSNETKKRKFTETIELQIRLKGYNIAKDKRFIGSIKLPNIIRPGLRIGILGDKIHCEQAAAINVPNYDLTTLQNFNKEKKTIKYWAKKHHLFLASETVIKSLNKTLGPAFNKTGKFPAPIRSSDKVADAVDEARKTVKFRLKKSIAFGVPVANVKMNQDQVYQNVMLATNYVVSLLKKQWQSIGAITLHSTMGKPHRVY
ncbi:60S ribosomal protein L10A [Tritrichomonas musculus]|uniref:60S ribosomal protein L10A n=1 Tax=Tritrichomonas musculus TaxID=1915356 RepID=A0ABR2JUA7_9EUKA